jgi:PAS domain S-box-containing protein
MPRVLLLVDHKENRRLLAEWLGRHYEVVDPQSSHELQTMLDAVVADGPALDRLWEPVRARKLAEQPCFLPVLVITSRQDVNLITRRLWQNIDELILAPIEKAELMARIEILLRARRCSLDLKDSNVQLEHAMLQRMEAESTVRDSERHYRELAEAMPLIVWTAQPNGFLDYSNQRWFSYSGLTLEETQGWGWQSALHPDDRQQCLERWNEALETGKSYQVESRLRRADGEYRWHLSHVLSVRDQRGRIIRWIRTNTDIDDQRQATESLRLLLEASASLASSLDLETVLQNLARVIVPSLADFFVVDLIEPDDSLRRIALAAADPGEEESIRELTDRYPRDPRRISIWPALQSGQPLVVSEVTDEFWKAYAVDPEHMTLARRIGTRSFVTLPLIVRNVVIGTMTMGMTRSGRRFTERDLPLAELLARRVAVAIENARLYDASRKAIRAREEFLAVTAHELKTPVATIRGLAQASLQELGDTDSLDQVRQSLQTIDQQAELLIRLVSQLRDVSRIEAGQFALERKLVDITRLVESVVLGAQVNAAKHSITMKAPSPVSAWIDALRMRQVFANLIDNAIKYSPAGQSIDVEVSPSDGGRACITVTDQGPGIAPDHRERIFERFYRARAGDYVGGMGLGLYISRQIVELHGGTISADFPDEGGARFVVRLPIHPETGASGATEQAKGGGAHPLSDPLSE